MRVKLAYVCYWFLLENDGVAYKIDGQVAQWRAAGHDVEIFCLTRSFGGRQLERDGWRTVRFEGIAGRVGGLRRLVAEVREWSPDAVYLRYDFFGPPVPHLLRSYPSAVEVNADDREESRLRRNHPRIAYAYNELNRRALFGSADALVCVTNELAEAPHFARFGRTAVIANGIDLERVRELPPAAGARPRLVFLGSAGQRWHGVDKLGRLAADLPEADFDVIGYDPTELGFTAPPNLTAHGRLSREQYEPLLAAADLAIGTLALHRKNMDEACPLKVREYLGHGLPVVIGYRDTDFLDAAPWFLLQLPNTEQNTRSHVEDVRRFLAGVRGRRVPRADVEGRIGAAGKEARRLELITELVRARGTA